VNSKLAYTTCGGVRLIIATDDREKRSRAIE
jgi:hypothetical protein